MISNKPIRVYDGVRGKFVERQVAGPRTFPVNKKIGWLCVTKPIQRTSIHEFKKCP